MKVEGFIKRENNLWGIEIDGVFIECGGFLAELDNFIHLNLNKDSSKNGDSIKIEIGE